MRADVQCVDERAMPNSKDGKDICKVMADNDFPQK
jgi:hypothetical protein